MLLPSKRMNGWGLVQLSLLCLVSGAENRGILKLLGDLDPPLMPTIPVPSLARDSSSTTTTSPYIYSPPSPPTYTPKPPLRISFLARVLASTDHPENDPNITTVLISTPISPNANYPFINSTFDPDISPDTKIPFTRMKVSVRVANTGQLLEDSVWVGIGVRDFKVDVNVGGLREENDNGRDTKFGRRRRRKETEKTSWLNILGTSPDAIQSFQTMVEIQIPPFEPKANAVLRPFPPSSSPSLSSSSRISALLDSTPSTPHMRLNKTLPLFSNLSFSPSPNTLNTTLTLPLSLPPSNPSLLTLASLILNTPLHPLHTYISTTSTPTSQNNTTLSALVKAGSWISPDRDTQTAQQRILILISYFGDEDIVCDAQSAGINIELPVEIAGNVDVLLGDNVWGVTGGSGGVGSESGEGNVLVARELRAGSVGVVWGRVVE